MRAFKWSALGMMVTWSILSILNYGYVYRRRTVTPTLGNAYRFGFQVRPSAGIIPTGREITKACLRVICKPMAQQRALMWLNPARGCQTVAKRTLFDGCL
jgi:hypothetical protein